MLLISADEEFDELCFEFGLELDEIVSNWIQMRSVRCLLISHKSPQLSKGVYFRKIMSVIPVFVTCPLQMYTIIFFNSCENLSSVSSTDLREGDNLQRAG